MSLWAPVTPAHTPSGPRPNLPELYTPDQTLPCRPSQRGKWAETSNIAERGLLFPAESRLPPLAEGPGAGELLGQLSAHSKQGPCPHLQAIHASHTSHASHARPALPATPGRHCQPNRLGKKHAVFFFPPHTPPPPLLSVDWVHTRALKCKQEICFSQSHSENIHLPQRGQPPDLVEGGGSGDGK